ncbi:MAG: dihydroorotase [Bacteroidetes bacterium]|nr:dihydroorotase [Bacteroidota bacterium]
MAPNDYHTPDLLIKGGSIYYPGADQSERGDILIKDGQIVDIGEGLSSNGTRELDATGKLISIGWMDMHVHLREPGQEHKETIESGCRAAAFGGFTAVACMPNTDPPIHTRDVVEFVRERGDDTPVDVHPIACVSQKREGEQLAEMADLKAGGAVAFSDDGSPVQDASLMRHALEYAKMLNAPIINHMEELSLNPHGQMHEGAVSTRLGLAGIPSLSEEVMIARDILLADFTGGHVHVAHISSTGAVELVRDAKRKGIPVTAEVCPHHFSLTHEEVETQSFDTHLKMHPPLRTTEDVDAIKEGLKDGTIDAICTDHAPHASFEKEVEFTAAPFGIIGLETAWGLIGRELIEPGILSIAEAIAKITTAPRRVLKLAMPEIFVGAKANLTVFDADTQWTFERSHIHSKSRNTPFIGSPMIGRAFAIYNRSQLVENDV